MPGKDQGNEVQGIQPKHLRNPCATTNPPKLISDLLFFPSFSHASRK
jgi:hypothetical protein